MDEGDEVEVMHMGETERGDGQGIELDSIRIQDATRTTAVSPLQVPEIIQLPDILEKELDRTASIDDLTQRLEAFLDDLRMKHPLSYEELVSMYTALQFGFSQRERRFLCVVEGHEIERMAKNLRRNLEEICQKDLQGKREELLKIKQFKIVWLALNVEHESFNVNHVLYKMPDEINQDLEDTITAAKDVDGVINTQQLLDDIQRGLFALDKNNAHLMHYLLKKFDDLTQHKTASLDVGQAQVASEPLSENVSRLLRDLGLAKHFRKKLSYEDIIALNSKDLEILDNEAGDQKPKSLADLPRFFIRNVIAVDGDTRENCLLDEVKKSATVQDKNQQRMQQVLARAARQIPDSSAPQDHGSSASALDLKRVHPLDLIYSIFLCADDFLRQELIDKMIQCQYAVPCILPSPYEQAQHLETLDWSLKTIFKTYKRGTKLMNETMSEASIPLVSCLTIGKETSWKNELINMLLNNSQNAFWHEGLKGEERQQAVSEGMVEVAWYLPGGARSDWAFDKAVTFASMSGDASKNPAIAHPLIEFSTVTCVFTEEIDKLCAFLRTTDPKTRHKFLPVVLYKSEDKHRVEAIWLKELCNELNLWKSNILVALERKNLHAALGDLHQVIAQKIEVGSVQLSEVLNKFRKRRTTEDVRETAAQRVMGLVGGHSRQEVLPCHSDLETRKELVKLEKELIRKASRQKNETETMHDSRVQEEIWKLQRKQLQEPLSPAFEEFLRQIISLAKQDRKYFLETLKRELNKKSVNILQPKRERYKATKNELKKVNSEDQQKELEISMAKLTDELERTSFGLEHFLREMAVLFENVEALKKQAKEDRLKIVLDTLSQVMAELLLDGVAFEIFDGDTAHVPDTWIRAVIQQIPCNAERRLFKVSALGVQSCGKSTLLNCTFGLNFPVSSGRCTKGAFMQLVKVEEEMRQTLNCDFVAVIDSEGMLSTADRESYDKELASFVICCSDLTLINLQGEGSEMKEILSIAVHKLLTLQKIGEKPSCRFVRHNIHAVDTAENMETGSDSLLERLNEYTVAAADDAGSAFKYFREVIEYNPDSDDTLVPPPFDGQSPRARFATDYSEAMKMLKAVTLKRIEELKNTKDGFTLAEFSQWLSQIWSSIKHENFVFSFKNTLAKRSYGKLRAVYQDYEWEIKYSIYELFKRKIMEIRNQVEAQQISQNEAERALIRQRAVINEMKAEATLNLRQAIVHFFECGQIGCLLCSPRQKQHTETEEELLPPGETENLKVATRDHLREVHHDALEKLRKIEHKRFLLDRQNEFLDGDWPNLSRLMKEDLNSLQERFSVKLDTSRKVSEINAEMETELKKIVQDSIAQEGERGSSVNPEEVFDEIWEKETRLLLQKYHKEEKELDIGEKVKEAMRAQLTEDERELYSKRMSDFGPEEGMYVYRSEHKHRSTYKWVKKRAVPFLPGRKDPDISGVNTEASSRDEKTNADKKGPGKRAQRLIAQSNAILKAVKDRFPWTEEGAEFSKTAADNLFRDVLKKINQNQSDDLQTTKQYKVDLLRVIVVIAEKCFRDKHRQYNSKQSPSAILKARKQHFVALFLMHRRTGDEAKVFADHKLKDIILKNLRDKEMTCSRSDLLQDLLNSGVLFRSRQSFQAQMMIDLYTVKSFATFTGYLTDFVGYAKDEMEFRCLRHFVKEDKFKRLALQTLEELLNKLCTDMKAVEKKSCDGSTFIKNFFQRIQSYVTLYDTADFTDREVKNVASFSQLVCDRLRGQVKKDCEDEIKAWDTRKQLEERDMRQFLFDELVGCDAKCPFCQAPCDAHSGRIQVNDGEDQNHLRNHSCSFHRPQGICGRRNKPYAWFLKRQLQEMSLISSDVKLASEDCTLLVSTATHKFFHGPDYKLKTLYKEYKKVYKDWDIQPDAHPDANKYWKWVFAHFNGEFAVYHDADQAQIPEEWGRFTEEEILTDIEKQCDVKINRETFTLE